jgi:hypothetical protein
MNRAQLIASRALWRRRLTYRQKRVDYYRGKAKEPKGGRVVVTGPESAAIHKWEQLRDQAKDMVARRDRQIGTGKNLKTTVQFDGVPLFRGLAYMLQDARDNGWKGRVNSADRRKGVPEKYGRLSQAALYAGWIARKAGFNPANPPGRSTHELRSDGVAYRGPVGRPLSWWQLGIDVTNASELREVLNRLGYSAFRPYPAGSEAHHVNLKGSPYRRLKLRRKT